MIEESNTPSDASVESTDGERPAEQPDRSATEKNAPQENKGGQVVVRYGRMKNLGRFRHNFKSPPVHGAKLVVRTTRGTELATTVINVSDADLPWNIGDESLRQYLEASGPDYPFISGGRVLRRANPQDINDQHHLDRSANDEAGFCREQIRQLGLDMKLIAVEHLLGGERVVFYFTAEHRVDFRELVRRLASQYHTRIEMHQVGARDEARLLADYERCGRQCCCREYLKLLKPVSMRMAKTQKATLDPAKISGRCGRLMCCLRYEDATYENLRTRLPKKNTWVRTADGVVGKVLEAQIITQLVRLMPADRTQVVVANEEIVERGLPAPPVAQTKVARPARHSPGKSARGGYALDSTAEKAETPGVREKSSAGPPDKPPTDTHKTQAGVTQPSSESEGDEKKKPLEHPHAGQEPRKGQPGRSSRRPKDGRKRRKNAQQRGGKKPGHPGALSAAPQVSSQSSKPQPAQQNKKKRRRKRKK